MHRFGHEGQNGALALRYIAHGENWVELAISLPPEMGGDEGDEYQAFGPVLTLLDMAGTVAVWQTIGRRSAIATLNLRLDYLGGQPGRQLRARANCLLSGDVAYVSGIAYSEEDHPVARCSASYMFTGD